jgi:hypothetical protein
MIDAAEQLTPTITVIIDSVIGDGRKRKSALVLKVKKERDVEFT